MKRIIPSLFILIVFISLCSFKNVSDEELIQMGITQETLNYMKTDTIQGQQGEIELSRCHATISVPVGYVFIDATQTKKLLVDYWGNPENRADHVLGAILPISVRYFYQASAAFIISYNNGGYVKDDDASSIDYDELLKGMQHATEEENKRLPEAQHFKLKGWAVTPYYDQNRHVLIWAKHLIGNDGETINYDMRILGKDGFVSINAVIDPECLSEAEAYGNTMISSLHYRNGYAYSDFDPQKDRMSEWTIGGLIAGSIIAKTGILAKIGVFLLKFWKLLALAFFGIVAGVTKIFKRKKIHDHGAKLAKVSKVSENTNIENEVQKRLMSEKLTKDDDAIEIDTGIGQKKRIAHDIIYKMNSIYDHLRYSNCYDTYVSDTSELTYSRMKGRWMGYLMALICDRMREDVCCNLNPTFPSPRPANAIFEVGEIDGEIQLGTPFKWAIVKKKMTSEEIKAVEDVDAKMNDFQIENILDYNLTERGIYEGMSVYLQKRPLSILCDKNF